eukprot:4524373-Pleurochrysis_carterae.AAC.1
MDALPAPRPMPPVILTTPHSINLRMPVASSMRTSPAHLCGHITPVFSTCWSSWMTTRVLRPCISERTRPRRRRTCDVSWLPFLPC